MKLLRCILCKGEVISENKGTILQKTQCLECGHESGNKEPEVMVIRKKQLDE